LIDVATDKPNPLKLLDDHIGEHLRASEAAGDLRAAPSYGRPLRFNDGYDETPAEWRMAMKILRERGLKACVAVRCQRYTQGCASPSSASTRCTAGLASMRCR